MLPTKPCLLSLSLRLTVKARARPTLVHAGVVFAVSAVFVARAAVCWAVMAVRFFTVHQCHNSAINNPPIH